MLTTVARGSGDLVSVRIMGQHMIILGSLKRAQDLLETRSTIYSSRPAAPMVNDLIGWNWNTSLMPYGDKWRKHRRSFHQFFNSAVCPKYRDVQVRESHEMLGRLLQDPSKFLEHTHYEPMVEAVTPGAFLVDLLPILKYIPTWFPFASFKRKAVIWKQWGLDMRDIPYEETKERFVKGEALPSVASTLIHKVLQDPDQKQADVLARSTAALGYYIIAGTDTITAFTRNFFLAMANNPYVQRKAQEELDAVVGYGRLPEFKDQINLPYVCAIIKEVHRWRPVIPYGFPHMSVSDDEYEGYFIPSGSVIVPNVWSILHNPEVYYEPERFEPDRFIKDGKLDLTGKDPEDVAFGFGRRVCQGRWFANDWLFLIVSHILACFVIEAPRDAEGKPVRLAPEYSSGLVSMADSFECNVRPRSEAMQELILHLQEED
ncbi:cytochrome P450 [Gloeophyllum trabeum ATCC 11539]|uniref:Cytochrome P450 n=1 Tax=Gloeophyllum trabeum (strain ATCC 11539 / FP-39264 / Madison 617) TaxID=670483 RepID=S7RM30_GLOTA|nr:cytochrome P450 [Gloeophyllum trabeum ATCC 11539]EPQ53769.1 cytochrome P450 [Gloeophyllum trabeum ATCC 11539]